VSRRIHIHDDASTVTKTHTVTSLRRLACSISTVIPLLSVAVAIGLLLTVPASAYAAPSPAWRIESFAAPTNFSPAQNAACLAETVTTNSFPACDYYVVTATDVAATPTDGEAITLADALPAGLTEREVGLYWSGRPNSGGLVGSRDPINRGVGGHPSYCTTSPPIECTLPATFFTTEGRDVQPGDTVRMIVFLAVDEPAALESTLSNHATVEGGGAAFDEVTAHSRLTEALPPFGVTDFSSYLAAPDGSPPTQAGAHAFELTTFIGLASKFRQTPEATEIGATSVEDLKDAVVDLPPGLAGSALSAKTCTFAQLSAQGGGIGACPADSRVGMLYTHPYTGLALEDPLYRMTAEHGAAAEYGFVDAIEGAHVLYASLAPTPAGYTLRVTAPEITQIWLNGTTVEFFGDPAARDAGRAEEPSDVPTFTMPADCDGEPLVTSVYVDSWQHPAPHLPDGEPDLANSAWVKATSESPPVSGCDRLAGLFRPTLEAHPETTRGDSPTGLDVNLKVPQDEGVETLATPPLRKAVVTLPQGMSVNPSSANGLQGCSLAQIGVSASGQPDGEAPQCPDASKIGEVELETPALSGVLHGQIYVARPSENPFKSLLAIYIAIDDPTTGVIVKLPGEVRANAQTGQLETVVDNSPQFPFSELRTHFFGGQKAALRTPAVCGKYEVTSELIPWSAPESGEEPATPAGTFEITQGCAPSAAQEQNAPAFEAGTAEPLAAAFSPFAMRLHREDGSQELRGLNVTLPKGLVAKLAGVGECSDAQVAAALSHEGEGGGAEEITSPSCPASSEVGTVTVGAGAGLTPYYTAGHAYLAGPYQGAPLSLVVITPAVAGPYDLGTVVVRAPLRVDPETAQVTAVSTLPTILDGIPLDVRSIALQMGRSQFTLNPTDCEKMAVTGAATSVLGQVANLTDPFQVGGCSSLGFAPKLSLSLKGKTNRGGFPALKAVLTMPPGGANIASAQVTLPHSEFIANAHIGAPCTRVQYAAGSCPAASVIGTARAETPLLEKPLEGPIYLMTGFGHLLPDLAVDLNGQIHVFVHGKVDKGKGGGLRNTFEVVPDAPVSKFTIELLGAGRGLLENSENICAKPQHALAEFTAQSGKVSEAKPPLQIKCKKAHEKHKRAHRRHRRHKRGRGR
jgi:hypothetical protein